jgi:predicted HicB family RNase H-like nuclease
MWKNLSKNMVQIEIDESRNNAMAISIMKKSRGSKVNIGSNTLIYKGYIGVIEYDDEAGIFHGEVINLHDVITFQGQCVTELREALSDSVEDYLEFCEIRGEQPEKPFSGHLPLRIDPQLHRRIYLQAKNEGKSVNRWISDTLEKYLA